MERALYFGSAHIRDTVTFVHHEWVCFESAANAEHAGGKLTIRLEQPDPNSLYLRFTYSTSLPDGMSAGEGLQVSEFVKAAYRESDVDTVRIIRMIAAGSLTNTRLIPRWLSTASNPGCPMFAEKSKRPRLQPALMIP